MILLPVILMIPYFFVLLWIYSRLIRTKPFFPSRENNRKVSVIVACRNEEKNLPSLLACLCAQDYPADLFEVVIIDDNSTDNTRSAAADYRGNLKLRVIPAEGRGKKEAIRTGVLQSDTELILCTDADCTPDAGWISSFVSIFEAEKPEMIAGPVRLKNTTGFPGKFQELEFLSLQAITAGTILSGHGTMCNGANLAFTRNAWLRSQKDLRFDIATGDDVFLLHSLKKQNAKITWIESPGAIVDTGAAPGIKALFRQRRRWASKSTAYRDAFSIFLGIVTFVTNLVFAVTIVASIADPRYILPLAAVFMLKSIPDFLLLHNVTSRYRRRNLMWWFLPSQIVYPFYVLLISLLTITTSFKSYTENHKEPQRTTENSSNKTL